MKVIVSAAISIDGYIDDCSPHRLKLSSEEDWEQIESLRADCDAILVGAGTVRKDNPLLVIKNPNTRKVRATNGLPENIVKVTVTRTGNLAADSHFFTQGEGKKIVYATFSVSDESLKKLLPLAEVVRAEKIDASFIVRDLSERGYKRLMVEGGTDILTMFFEQGEVDEFRLAIAPFFVGEENAPKLVRGGAFFWNKYRRMKIKKVEKLGDTTVIHFTR